MPEGAKSKQKKLCAGSVRCDIPYRCLCRNCLGYSVLALLPVHCHLKDPLQILLSSLKRNRFEGLHLQNRTKKPLSSAQAPAFFFLLEPELLRSSPRLISTGQLHTLLHFHLRPINDIVYVVPYSMKDERSYLRESFTLRCFQRLSRPDVATQLCPWQDN